MAYIEQSSRSEVTQKSEPSLITREQVFSRPGDTQKFYELELAVVVDVILDENHEIFSSKTIDIQNFPGKPSQGDIDYSWIGRAKIRLQNTDKGKDTGELAWAIPFEGINQDYPLVNEPVVVGSYLGNYYYTRINHRNFINHNADYRFEKIFGLRTNGVGQFGVASNTRNPSIEDKDKNFVGSLGKYFKSNDSVRGLKRFEGDTVIESRFGQSIRMGAYDDNRENDKGDSVYSVYKDGGGNPMILIRNRQRSLDSKNPLEKNVGGRILEDINNDGTSIQITSGLTISKWKTDTIHENIFQQEKGRISQFAPSGCSPFKYPVLDGDQYILQSDRVILSARTNELFLYSKKRMGFSTDSEFTINASDQSVLTSHKATHVNSPYIFLGDYGVTEEPIVLGQSTTQWMYGLIEWLKTHTHFYKHNHPKTGNATPDKTQVTPQMAGLIALQNQIPNLISDRVFTVGRGTTPINLGAKQSGNPPTIGSVGSIPSRTRKVAKII